MPSLNFWKMPTNPWILGFLLLTILPVGGLAQSVSGTGTFNYTLLINLPNGTMGMKPTLSLVYDSDGPNGMVGVGWSLTGLSAIYRDNSFPVKFLEGDHYAIDGVKLIYNSSTNCYHKEFEDYSKIEYINGNTTSSYWVVTAKDGIKRYYGKSTDSHIDGVGTGILGKALIWTLNRVEDTYGNYFTITYTEDTENGDYYPLRIRYTNNVLHPIAGDVTVDFTYEDRTDHHVRFRPTKVDMGSRLREVTVTIEDLQGQERVLSRYEIEYVQSRGTGNSLLQSYQEFGTDGGDLPAVTFGWDQGGDVGFEDPQPWINDGSWGNYSDRFAFSGPTSKSLEDEDIEHTATGLDEQARWFELFGGADWEYSGPDVEFGLIDMNNDGILDRVACNYGCPLWVNDWNLDSFSTSLYDAYLCADFGLWVALGTQDGFLEPTKWLDMNAWGNGLSDTFFADMSKWGNAEKMLIDMNGDGLPDRVSSYYSPPE